MKLLGAQIIAEVLLDHSVDTVFGYPGGAALNVYDQLYKYSDRIKHVMTAHEQGASHAADGYARATGKVGVVIATSGPGATNLVTGLATANMDSIPMIAITSNVPDAFIGRDAFQEVCITGITMPVTKHNFFVNDINELEKTLRLAFKIANSDRKGPVLIDVTKDVTSEMCEFTNKEPMELKAHPKADVETVSDIAKMINEAKKPVIYFGGGVTASDAGEEMAKLISKADIPATYTLMAAGVIGYDNPKSLGLIGMHGTISSNHAIDNADLIIAMGTRFSDRVALNPNKFGKKAKIVQVDIDRSEIDKNVLVDLSCICDIKDFLLKILPMIDETNHDKWIAQIAAWKERENNEDPDDGRLHPRQIMEAVCDLTDKDTIYATDVGQHQMWAAQYLKHKNTKRFLTSGGLGTMGYGYGAAIGAQIGKPDFRVIHITGDGSFHMNLNEAATAVTENLPIITIIVNNSVLGMVYQWQTLFYGKRYSSTTVERKTDYVKLADGFGLVGFRATNPKELEEAMKKAIKIDGPVWIECIIPKEERVLPMIPGGGNVEDMIVG
ncbi:MAG: biosynthetic-type acetolactate synthase large subunit [Peptostreptococcaceae bacterium]|nr:biosynthetic-type acetolactate synthase large subunit [Peptostreptococcaceae bacterium]